MKNSKLLISLFLIILIFLPFWIHDSGDNIEGVKVDNKSIGYYQANTCEISLLEVYLSNLGNENNVVYSNNHYVGIECFGKVTGLDKVGEKYIVSIGSNTSLFFILQSLIWLGLISLIKPSKQESEKKVNLLFLILPLLFTAQHISENRFYQRNNIYTIPNDGEIFNYIHIFGVFLTYYLIFIIFSDLAEHREQNFVNYLPYTFLVVGTFSGMNINFYLLLLSYFGVKNFIVKNTNLKFNLTYFSFGLLWLFTRKDSNSFFDTDKLNGYINSSNNTISLIFWSFVVFLSINGLQYLFKISEIDLNKLKKSFLYSGSLLVVLGTIGSTSSFVNFFNYFIFGQNKRGINKLESIAGNTWRGFSASAESVGEYYAFIIIFLLLFLFHHKVDLYKKDYLMIGLILLGLYRTNNFAAFSSGVLIVLIFLFNNYVHDINYKKIVFASLGLISIGGLLFHVNKMGYEYLSTHLLYEASLHSNFFENELDDYNKTLVVKKYFDEQNIEFLVRSYGDESISTSLKTLTNIYFVKFNIPFIPNIVALLSLISLLINRSEMWGIFFAKYSPNTIEALFGNGPLQMNNYLYAQKVRLDLPPELMDSLFLPHSSIFDILIFFGIIGVILFSVFSIKTLYSYSENSYFKYLLFFLLLNILKSDSLLYLNSGLLFFLTYSLIKKGSLKYE